jgi:hypothetical protein
LETPFQQWDLADTVVEIADTHAASTAPQSEPVLEDSPSDLGGQTRLSFDLSVRDHLLALAVDACEAENRLAVVSAFLTCSGLENLATKFLAWQAEQQDTFIHVPKFSVAEVRTELLLAVVASGATRSPSPAVQRLGSRYTMFWEHSCAKW